MSRSFLAAIRIGFLDMRGDLRRFALLVTCLAVGTALIAGVSSVGASIAQAVDQNTAELMGGTLELSRADRPATAEELAAMANYGGLASVVDTNVRARAGDREAFVDLSAVGATYPLLGRVASPQLAGGAPLAAILGEADGRFGALLDPLLLDQLGIAVGDSFVLGGTTFEARGALTKLPDTLARGFRLGLTALIGEEGFRALSDRSSPLPGLGSWYRYKLLIEGDADAALAAIQARFGPGGWTVRSAREGLGPMVHYYDLFMRFLVLVGLGSLLIGGVSVWAGMRAYVAERSGVIAILRSLGAGQGRIALHFFAQVGVLALAGVGAGLAVGAAIALVVLPAVGAAVGIALAPALHLRPLLTAGGAGLLTAFAFAYLPLQQAQAVQPIELFRARGLAAPAIDWRAMLASRHILPLLLAVLGFAGLAFAMTGDMALVLSFGLASALAAGIFQLFIRLVQAILRRLPAPRIRMLRQALRGLSQAGGNASAIVVSVGMALAMLSAVLVLQDNLRQEFFSASAFDAPTLVASDLFPDEVETLAALSGPGTDITRFVSTPMLRGALVAINGQSPDSRRTHGPEASFLLSGDVPLTFRAEMPASSRLVSGQWWPADYSGPGLVSLHQSLRAGLGVALGDSLTFDIFGDAVTVTIANFRDYSWQGGIDFLASFSPGVLDAYPTTLFAAVTAAPGREEAVARRLAADLPDVNFIAIGDTLKQITIALGQLSFAASLVGGVAVGNGLLVLIGSLATGRRQREADAVITKVLGATRLDLLGSAFVHYLLLALLAAIPALVLGIGMAWGVTLAMMEVDFVLRPDALCVVLPLAILVTALLGAMTILRAVSIRPARLLRDL